MRLIIKSVISVFIFLVLILFICTCYIGSCGYNASHSPSAYMEAPTSEDLVRGMIAYKIPDTMAVGDDHRAIASITKALNDSILFHRLDTQAYVQEEITVSSRVKVVLLDPTGSENFQIVALNSDEQLVDDSTNTVWNWNVIPKRSGSNALILRATIKTNDRLGENEKDLVVFDREIEVRISPVVAVKEFVGNYWQWLTTVCFAPLFVFCFKKINTRRKKRAGDSSRVQAK